MPLAARASSAPNRRLIFSFHGFQWRFAALVAGSMTVLLLFAGLHGLFVAKLVLPQDVSQQIQPALVASTLRVFLIGSLYIAVVTVAAAFLSHTGVGGGLTGLNRLNEKREEQ